MSAAPDSETAPAPGRLLQPPRDPDAKVHHHHHLRMRLPLSEGGCYHHKTTPRIIYASTHIKCVLLLCGELAEGNMRMRRRSTVMVALMPSRERQVPWDFV